MENQSSAMEPMEFIKLIIYAIEKLGDLEDEFFDDNVAWERSNALS